jgi:hypothetical protein
VAAAAFALLVTPELPAAAKPKPDEHDAALAVTRKLSRESELPWASVACIATAPRRWACTWTAPIPNSFCWVDGQARVRKRPHSWRVRLVDDLRAASDEC